MRGKSIKAYRKQDVHIVSPHLQACSKNDLSTTRDTERSNETHLSLGKIVSGFLQIELLAFISRILIVHKMVP